MAGTVSTINVIGFCKMTSIAPPTTEYPRTARMRVSQLDSSALYISVNNANYTTTPVSAYARSSATEVNILCGDSIYIYRNGLRVGTGTYHLDLQPLQKVAFAKSFFSDTVDSVIIYDNATNYHTLFFETEHGTKPNPQFLLKLVVTPEMSDDEYDFKGWFYEPTFETQAQFDDTLTSDTTLYAKWEESGGGGAMLDVTYGGTKIIDSLEVTPPVAVTYDGSTIATLNAGDTKTLQCNGKVMASDVVIGDKTLQCNGKLMASDVVVEVEG